MKKGSCVHFNGIQNNTCEKGVAYSSFNGRIPCLTYRDGSREAPKEKCALYTEPTEEQIKTYEAETREVIKRFSLVTPLINRIKKEHRGQSWQGVEECPVCKGRLHMSHAACNGHVWGKCETEGCLSWME